ncbi:TetR/AcrR family transcriptional regulator [Microbacterium sp. LS_15]|uniref:TetR/AcrR family transcriptional regulator n=1 Tax=Microbacterium sp. LS_15 TaxID=3055790 RepID=UPI0035BF8679
MDTKRKLLDAAAEVIERDGVAGFSTRSVCAIVGVGAPTLYHHFGSADGLLSAAFSDAFDQFLARKSEHATDPDPVKAMREGWDDYVGFAGERPGLYAAMLARVLSGAKIGAVTASFEHLARQVHDVARSGRLAVPEAQAAQLAWGSVNAAAMLHVTAALGLSAQMTRADPSVIASIRDDMFDAISPS